MPTKKNSIGSMAGSMVSMVTQSKKIEEQPMQEVIEIIQGADAESAPFLALAKDGKRAEQKRVDVRNMFILLDFGGMWCPYCRTFAPKVKEIWEDKEDDSWPARLREKGKRGLVILVSADKNNNEFIQHLNMLPGAALAIASADPRNAKLKALFNVSGFPSAVLVDVEGKTISTKARQMVIKDEPVWNSFDLSVRGLLTADSSLVTDEGTVLEKGGESLTKPKVKAELQKSDEEAVGLLLVFFQEMQHPMLEATDLSMLEALARDGRIVVVMVQVTPMGKRKSDVPSVLLVPAEDQQRTQWFVQAALDDLGDIGETPAAVLMDPKGTKVISGVHFSVLRKMVPDDVDVIVRCQPWEEGSPTFRQLLNVADGATLEAKEVKNLSAKDIGKFTALLSQCPFAFVLAHRGSVNDEENLAEKMVKDLVGFCEKAELECDHQFVVLVDPLPAVENEVKNKFMLTFVVKPEANHQSKKHRDAPKSMLGFISPRRTHSASGEQDHAADTELNDMINRLYFWNSITKSDETYRVCAMKSLTGELIKSTSMSEMLQIAPEFPTPSLLKPFAGLELLDKGGRKNGKITKLSFENFLDRARKANKNVGILFSGSWCYWCRDLRPHLVRLYEKSIGTASEFEIIFISSDRTEKDMDEFYAQMPWNALSYGDRELPEITKLEEQLGVEGIPHFEMVNTRGELLDTNRAIARIKQGQFPLMQMFHKHIKHAPGFMRLADYDAGDLDQYPVIAQPSHHNLLEDESLANSVYLASVSKEAASVRIWGQKSLADRETELAPRDTAVEIAGAHDKHMRTVGLSFNGEYLVTGDESGEVKVWVVEMLLDEDNDPKNAVLLKLQAKDCGEAFLTQFMPVDDEYGGEKLIVVYKTLKGGRLRVLDNKAYTGLAKPNDSDTGVTLELKNFNGVAVSAFSVSTVCVKTLMDTVSDKIVNLKDAGPYLAYGSGSGDFAVIIKSINSEEQESERSQGQESERPLEHLKGHTAVVTCMAFLYRHDSQFGDQLWPTLISGSGDKTLRVWCTLTRKCVNTLQQHKTGIVDVRAPSVLGESAVDDRPSTPYLSGSFISLDSSGVAIVWNTRIWAPIRRFDFGLKLRPEDKLTAVEIRETADGVHDQLFLASSDGVLFRQRLSTDAQNDFDPPCVNESVCRAISLDGREPLPHSFKALLSTDDGRVMFAAENCRYRGVSCTQVFALDLTESGVAKSGAELVSWSYPVPVCQNRAKMTIQTGLSGGKRADIEAKHTQNWNLVAHACFLQVRGQTSVVAAVWNDAEPKQVTISYLRAEGVSSTAVPMATDQESAILLCAAVGVDHGSSDRPAVVWAVECRNVLDDTEEEENRRGMVFVLPAGLARNDSDVAPRKLSKDGDTRVVDIAFMHRDSMVMCLHADEKVRLLCGNSGNQLAKASVANALLSGGKVDVSQIERRLTVSVDGQWSTVFESVVGFTGRTRLMIHPPGLAYEPIEMNGVVEHAWRPPQQAGANPQVAVTKRDDPAVYLWDVVDKRVVATMQDSVNSSPSSHVTRMSWSRSGTWMICEYKLSRYDNLFQVRVWDCNDFTLEMAFSTDEMKSSELVFVHGLDQIVAAYDEWEGLKVSVYEMGLIGEQPPVGHLVNAFEKDWNTLMDTSSTGASAEPWAMTKRLISRFPGLAFELAYWSELKEADGEGASRRQERSEDTSCKKDESKKQPEGNDTNGAAAPAHDICNNETDDDEMMELFNKLDDNSDGYVTLDEVVCVFGPNEKVKTFFNKADTNRDGQLELKEFAKAYKDFLKMAKSKPQELDQLRHRPLPRKKFAQPLLQHVLTAYIKILSEGKDSADGSSHILTLLHFILPETLPTDPLRASWVMTPSVDESKIEMVSPIHLIRKLVEHLSDSSTTARAVDELLQRIMLNLGAWCGQNHTLTLTDQVIIDSLNASDLMWVMDRKKSSQDLQFAVENLIRNMPLQRDASSEYVLPSYWYRNVSLSQKLNVFDMEVTQTDRIRAEDNLRNRDKLQSAFTHMSLLPDESNWDNTTYSRHLLPFRLCHGQGTRMLQLMSDLAKRTKRVKVFQGDYAEFLVEYMWQKRGRMLYFITFVAFLVMVIMTIALILNHQKWMQDDLEGVIFAVQIVKLSLLGIFVFIEFMQATYLGIGRYATSPWNVLDSASNAIILWSTYLQFQTGTSGKSNVAHIVDPICMVLLAIRLLYYLRAFNKTGPLVYMIMTIGAKLVWFMLIIVVLIVGFAVAFHDMTRSSMMSTTELWSEFRNMFYGLLGMIELSEQLDNLPQGQAITGNVLFVLFICINCIVLLNLLIAVVDRYYDVALEDARARWRSQQVDAMVDIEPIRMLLKRMNLCMFDDDDGDSEEHLSASFKQKRKDSNAKDYGQMRGHFIHGFTERTGASGRSSSSDAVDATVMAMTGKRDVRASAGGQINTIYDLLKDLSQTKMRENMASCSGDAANPKSTVNFVSRSKLPEHVNSKPEVTHDGQGFILRKSANMSSSVRMQLKCFNCEKTWDQLMREDHIFVSIDAQEQCALCMFCARIPDESRSRPSFKGNKLTPIVHLSTQAPSYYCDGCGRHPELLEADGTPAVDDDTSWKNDRTVVWHGGQVDLCPPCMSKELRPREGKSAITKVIEEAKAKPEKMKAMAQHKMSALKAMLKKGIGGAAKMRPSTGIPSPSTVV